MDSAHQLLSGLTEDKYEGMHISEQEKDNHLILTSTKNVPHKFQKVQKETGVTRSSGTSQLQSQSNSEISLNKEVLTKKESCFGISKKMCQNQPNMSNSGSC